MADLLPVQTLGYDRVDGKVLLSVSSCRGTDELPTVILQGSGSSITASSIQIRRIVTLLSHLVISIIQEDSFRGKREDNNFCN